MELKFEIYDALVGSPLGIGAKILEADLRGFGSTLMFLTVAAHGFEENHLNLNKIK